MEEKARRRLIGKWGKTVCLVSHANALSRRSCTAILSAQESAFFSLADTINAGRVRVVSWYLAKETEVWRRKGVEVRIDMEVMRICLDGRHNSFEVIISTSASKLAYHMWRSSYV